MPRQNTSPANYPQAVLQQIEHLAQNIVIARKRRGESQTQWARRLGISQPTMARIERGDPSVAMASYVMCMWLINQAEGLADLIAPQHDHAALEKEVAKVRAKPKSSKRVNPGGSYSNLEAPANSPQSEAATDSLVRLGADRPLADVRQSMVRPKKRSDLALPTVASGLAALLAKSASDKK